MRRLPVKVNWFIPVNHRDYNRMSASVWIRCLQLLPYLEQHGITSTVNELETDIDIAMFVRFQNDTAYQTAVQQKSNGRKIIFDLCVNYFDETVQFEGIPHVTTEHVTQTKRMVEVADVVVCGSEFIRQRASNFHPQAVYIPESINRKHFRFKKFMLEFEKSVLKAIWSGHPTKAGELAELYPLLARRGISLVVISEKKPQLPGPYTYIPWTYQTFPKAILQGDLCVTPRRIDNPYNLGHSHLKIGIFMAQGVPALAAPLPSYIEVIEASRGGKICETESDWETALEQVVEDRQILKRWSREAFQGMLAYSTEAIAKKYAKLFQHVMESMD